MWWLTSVIPAIWEAEAGRSLEEFETSLPNKGNPISTEEKKKYLSMVMPACSPSYCRD